jgi:hypothetical protein
MQSLLLALAVLMNTLLAEEPPDDLKTGRQYFAGYGNYLGYGGYRGYVGYLGSGGYRGVGPYYGGYGAYNPYNTYGYGGIPYVYRLGGFGVP